MTKRVGYVIAAMAFTLVCGCSHRGMVVTHETPNAVHYVVVGFGVLSVPKSPQPEAATAAKFSAVGISLSNQPGLSLGIGYSASSVVSIPANAEDVRVEVGSCAGGGLRVTTERAILAEPTN